jgi:hypothetical protein
MEPTDAEETVQVTDDLSTVRDLILRAHPDAVPELITGGTIAELTASIEPARAAYQRVVEAALRPDGERGEGGKDGEGPAPPTVPAGGAPMVVDLDRLPTAELLRRGVAQRSR